MSTDKHPESSTYPDTAPHIHAHRGVDVLEPPTDLFPRAALNKLISDAKSTASEAITH